MVLFYDVKLLKKMADEHVNLKSWERQIQATFPPKYLNLISKVSEAEEVSKSSVIRDIVKQHFDRMPPSEIQQIKTRSSNHY